MFWPLAAFCTPSSACRRRVTSLAHSSDRNLTAIAGVLSSYRPCIDQGPRLTRWTTRGPDLPHEGRWTVPPPDSPPESPGGHCHGTRNFSQPVRPGPSGGGGGAGGGRPGPVLGPARTEAAAFGRMMSRCGTGVSLTQAPSREMEGIRGESTAPAPSGRVAGKGSVGTMREAVILEAVRTPLGKRGGRLESWHPVDLLGATLSELVSRSGIDPSVVDDVIGGCVSQVGEQTFNVT